MKKVEQPMGFKVVTDDDYAYISVNLRTILEHGWEEDLKYAGAPTEYHVKACCFKIDTCLHVYKDTTRHRTLSFAIESTR